MSSSKSYLKYLNPFKLLDFVQSTFLKILIVIVIVILLLTGLTYLVKVIVSGVDSVDKYFEIQDYQKGFYEKIQDGDLSSVDEGLKSFVGLDIDLDEYTQQEKVVLATSTATKLAVFEVDVNHVTNLQGEYICSYLNSFTYEDNFDMFVVNDKWLNFYNGLSVFETGTFEYTYFSNVYVEGAEFPLQYFEDQTFTKKYTKSFGDLYSFVIFDDLLQIVLPDVDKDEIADNIDLDYVFSLTDIYQDSEKLSNQITHIPVKIQNGDFIISGGSHCTDKQLERYDINAY